jgi:hypothetical protein
MEHNRRVAQQVDEIQDRLRPVIGSAVASVYRSGVGEIADYLSSAGAVNRLEAKFKEQARSATVTEVATQRNLDSARLTRWVDELERARSHRNHPLHLWSRAACTEDSDTTDRTEIILKQVIRDCDQSEAQARQSGQGVQPLVNMRNPAAEDWSQDGFAFGLRPRRAGDIRFSSDPARPIAEVFWFAAAQSEPGWEVQLAPGTERDPGKVAWAQSGKTLRTRTFTLSQEKLYYLVRGAGNAYAAVDSHRLIAGPLHGSLTRSWDAEPDGKIRWIEHNLAGYRGHRVHVEFSPKDKEPEKPSSCNELALLAVVEAEQAPPELLPPHVGFWRKLDKLGVNSCDSLAQAYEATCLDVLKGLGADQIVGSPDADTLAWLATWIIRNPGLMAANDWEMAARVASATESLLEPLTTVLHAIRRESLTAPALLDGSSVDEYILNRGNHRTPGAVVPRRFLEAVAVSNHNAQIEAGNDRGSRVSNAGDGSPQCFLSGRHGIGGSGRLSLAREMVDPNNSLVARVIVNRLWHHLYGRGIVASVDNLGVLGDRPTHPELLDYLASQFVEGGWSMKRMIRRMMLSSTYQMSSRAEPAAEAQDPGNLLLHHMPVRRLQGEVIRDNILAVSGRLDASMFGPGVEVHLTPFMEGRGRPSVSGPLDGAGRRSIYLRVRRNFPHPMLIAFDAPTPFSTIGRRSVSNVPAQALSLMNSKFVLEEAQRWARHGTAETADPSNRVRRMFLEAYSRPCTDKELSDSLQFIADQQEEYRQVGATDSDHRPWEDLAHVLLNTKEFIFVP